MVLVIPRERCHCGKVATTCTGCAWRCAQVGLDAVFAASWERMVMTAVAANAMNFDDLIERFASAFLAMKDAHSSIEADAAKDEQS